MYGGSLGEISNKADWKDAYSLIDEDNELINLTDAAVTFNVTRGESDSILLSGSVASGELSLPSLGIIEWAFPPARLSNLCTGTHNVGVIVSRDDEVLQLFLGTVTVKKGL